jgi:hypothetical protein
MRSQPDMGSRHELPSSVASMPIAEAFRLADSGAFEQDGRGTGDKDKGRRYRGNDCRGKSSMFRIVIDIYM